MTGDEYILDILAQGKLKGEYKLFENASIVEHYEIWLYKGREYRIVFDGHGRRIIDGSWPAD